MSEVFYGHVIDNEEVPSVSGETMDVLNPYTNDFYGKAAVAGQEDVDRAIEAARRAFDEGPWPRMGYAERSELIYRFTDLLKENKQELAEAESRDMGKPLAQALNDVNRTIQNYEFFADHAKVTGNEAYPSDSGHLQYTRYEPAGVVVAIAPWNFPIMLESWKVAPALAWGNTVVLKPSEDSPATATLMARLAVEAGFPKGVFNVVQGAGATGGMLTAHEDIDRVTFTGSSATGKILGKAVAENLVPASLELGGKGANIVFDDADIDNAIYWSKEAIFRNAGQVCLAGSRLFVQRGIYDKFMEKFVEAAEGLKIGDPTDPETEYGPLASRKHFDKVTGYLETVEENGGKIVSGGKVIDGLFVEPTILEDLGPGTPHYDEEIFGPVVVVTPFDTEDEAVHLANDTPYGLNAIIFTENLSKAHRVAKKLKAGTVWINCFFIRDLRLPFGGVGESGVGREGGVYSRDFFTEPKAVVVQIDEED